MTPLFSRRFVTLFALLVLCLMAGTFPGQSVAQSAEARGLQIATQAAERSTGFRDSTAVGEMVLRDANGAISTRRFNAQAIAVSEGETRSRLMFEWPGDIRGTTLLTHSFKGRRDDQWIYLPDLNRTRRVSGSARSGSFVGSEFAYEDLANQDVESFSHVWIADQACPSGGGACHVVDRMPRDGSAYSRQRVWFDQSRLQVRQVQYFDRRGQHVKTLSASEWRHYNNRYWRASFLRMVNLQTGKSTDLRWTSLAFDQGLEGAGFQPQDLGR